MKPRDILFGSDGKLRSGWRAAIFGAAFAFALVLLGTITFPLMSFAGFPRDSNPALFTVLGAAVPLAAALLMGWLCGKYLESLPFRALGAWFTNGWLKHLILGIVIGAATISLAIGIASLFGNLDFSFNTADTDSILRTLIVSFVIFAVAAAFEEALFRGYILQTFARSGLAWPAIVLTSAFFGAVHLDNPNAGYISSLNTAIAGIWFGVAYLKTRDLWLVWGLHLMWNWMQGSIFGVEVSGLTAFMQFPLLKETDGGPAWLTGENYGIEASIACTIALIVSMLVIHYLPILEPSNETATLTSPRTERFVRIMKRILLGLGATISLLLSAYCLQVAVFFAWWEVTPSFPKERLDEVRLNTDLYLLGVAVFFILAIACLFSLWRSFRNRSKASGS